VSIKVHPEMRPSHWVWHRNEARARLAIEVTVETLGARRAGFILNLSCHGAMVQTTYDLIPGTELVLKCPHLDVFGAVAWAKNGRAGVEFAEPISEQLVIDLRQIADDIARYAKPGLNGRPGLQFRPLTAEEQEVAQEWASSRNFL
jgi:hypothetical protein